MKRSPSTAATAWQDSAPHPGCHRRSGRARLLGTWRKKAEADLARIESYLSEGQRLSHTGSYAWILASGEFWPDERFRIFGLDPTVKPTLELMLERIHADEAAPY